MRGLRDIILPSGGGGGTAGADGGVAVTAAGASASTGTVIFSNANGVSFGMAGQTITASVAAVAGAQTGISGIIVSDATYTSGTVSFSNQANITIGSSVNGATQYIRLSGHPAQTVQPVAASAANGLANFSTLSFSNVNGVSFATAAGPAIQASVAAGATATGNLGAVAVNALTTYTSGTVVFSNSNGVTFGTAGQTITATVKTDYLTTAMASNRGSDFVQATAVFNGTNASGTIASGAISVSVAAPVAQTNQTVGLYASSNTYLTSSGTVDARSLSFRGDKSITVGVSAGEVLFSVGPYITTAMLSNAATISNIRISAGTTNNLLSNFSFSDVNGVSFGINGSTITASVAAAGGAQTGISGIIVSDATYTSGTVSFSNQANITIGSSVNGATQYIRLSGNPAQTTQSAIKAFGASNTGNTAGNTGVSTGIDWVVAGSNNITISESTVGGGPNTIWVSGPTVGGLQTGISGIVVSDTTYTSGTVSFSAQANITIGSSVNGATQYIRLSVGAGGGGGIGGGVSTGGNTAGSTGTVTTGNIIFVGSGPISLSQSTGAAGSAATITINAPATSSLVGINGISISTNGSTISVYPKWISSFENDPNGPKVAATLNGASISHAVAFYVPQPISMSFLRLPVSMTTNSTTLSTSAAAANMSVSVVSTWNAVIYSLGNGANSKSLQSITSGSNGWTLMHSMSVAANGTQYSVSQFFSAQVEGAGTTRTTQYSISNTNYSLVSTQIATEFSGGRMLDIPMNGSLSPGNYWLVFGYSSNSASNSARLSAGTNCGAFYSNHYGDTQTNMAFGIMGSTNLTSGGLLGVGSFSTAGGGTTNSIPLSAISSAASHLNPYFQLLMSA